MELAPLLVVLGLAAVTVAYIARPLVEGRSREPDVRERRLSALRAEQDQLLDLLHELEMDYAMGKIEPDDFQAQRAARVHQGAALLRELDELRSPPHPRPPDPARDNPRPRRGGVDLPREVRRLSRRMGGRPGTPGLGSAQPAD